MRKRGEISLEELEYGLDLIRAAFLKEAGGPVGIWVHGSGSGGTIVEPTVRSPHIGLAITEGAKPTVIKPDISVGPSVKSEAERQSPPPPNED